MDRNYVIILEDSLRKKIAVLDEILALCEEQKNMLSDDMELTALDPIIAKKETLISEIEKLDEGFETLYERVEKELKENKEMYADRIREMQKMIREITEKSNMIRAAEDRYRELISGYFGKRRNEVKEGRVNSRAAMNYYKVQSNSAFGESRFMDSKK